MWIIFYERQCVLLGAFMTLNGISSLPSDLLARCEFQPLSHWQYRPTRRACRFARVRPLIHSTESRFQPITIGMTMKTVLVTGGAGFIGSAVVRRIINAGDSNVVNVDSLTYAANLESLGSAADSPRYRFEFADIANAGRLAGLFDEYQPRSVLHLAAETHVDRSIEGAAPFIHSNVVGTSVLLDVALDFWRKLPSRKQQQFRFVHISTDEVYGSLSGAGQFNENSRYKPNSPYAASKAAADHLVRAWHKTHGFPTVTTNCSNNFGPFQFPEKLIPHMIISAIEGRPLGVYGDGAQIRDWLHVEDHVNALLAVLERGRIGEVYTIGARNEQRNIDVVTSICAVLDQLHPRADGRSYTEQITYVVDRPGHDRRYAIDPSKIERDLYWRPQRDWVRGLKETIEWYLENRSWWEGIRSGAYRGERLGLGR